VQPQNCTYRFLVDTGSTCSIIPFKVTNINTNQKFIQTKPLYAANGSTIKTFGKTEINIIIDDKEYPWTFIIADVTNAIIGADFLSYYKLVVDCNHRKIYDQTKQMEIKLEKNMTNRIGTINTQKKSNNKTKITTYYNSNKNFERKTIRNLNDYKKEQINCTTYKEKNNKEEAKLIHTFNYKIKNIIEKYQEITEKTNKPKNKIQVNHTIITNGLPVHAKTRPLTQEKYEAAKKIFNELLECEIITPSNSNWSSALMMKKKANGEWRCCGDYRQLNAITTNDVYPLPLIKDVTTRLNRAKTFSKIDLESAYHQIPMNPEDIKKTAITTPFGLYEFKQMPFGLKNAAATFQRTMNNIFMNCENTVTYIDDILIGSKNEEEHKKDLENTFKLLQINGLKINLKKCDFFKNKINFLGYQISHNKIEPIPEKIHNITKLQPPRNVHEIRRFLGMINFYHDCIPHCSELLADFNEQIKNKKKNENITWNDTLEKQFNKIKKEINQITGLEMLQNKGKLSLTTDASNIALGAVLEQEIENKTSPLGFFSQKLKEEETKYSTYDRELLAIIKSIKHFKHILESRQFKLYTDHKPLIHMFNMKDPSPRQLRHINYISQYNLEIIHISGKSNIVADYLSRTEINDIHFNALINIDDIKGKQEEVAKECSKYKSLEIIKHEDFFYDNSTQHNPRLLIPKEYREKCISSIHNMGHYSYKTTYQMIHLQVCWPLMRKDIKNFVDNCLVCNLNKTSKHPKINKIDYPETDKLETIHIDIVGPLPTNKNIKYLLTMIDRNTNWFEAIPIKDITADTVVEKLEQDWISRYGPPKNIISDQGKQFEAEIFKALCKKHNINKIRTTPYNPQSNGKIERFHRTLKETLRTKCYDHNWLEKLPETLYALRIKPNTKCKKSPWEKLFGTIGTPNIIHKKHTPQNDTQNRLSIKKGKFPSDEEKCESHQAFVKEINPKNFREKYKGPYKILKIQNNTALIEINGTKKCINLRRIKIKPKNKENTYESIDL